MQYQCLFTFVLHRKITTAPTQNTVKFDHFVVVNCPLLNNGCRYNFETNIFGIRSQFYICVQSFSSHNHNLHIESSLLLHCVNMVTHRSRNWPYLINGPTPTSKSDKFGSASKFYIRIHIQTFPSQKCTQTLLPPRVYGYSYIIWNLNNS